MVGIERQVGGLEIPAEDPSAQAIGDDVALLETVQSRQEAIGCFNAPSHGQSLKPPPFVDGMVKGQDCRKDYPPATAVVEPTLRGDLMDTRKQAPWSKGVNSLIPKSVHRLRRRCSAPMDPSSQTSSWPAVRRSRHGRPDETNETAGNATHRVDRVLDDLPLRGPIWAMVTTRCGNLLEHTGTLIPESGGLLRCRHFVWRWPVR